MGANIFPWLDLLNSDWHDYLGSGRREDRLDDPRWLGAFLRRWRLNTGRAARIRVAASFRCLRKTLRSLADAFAAGGKGGLRDWGRLNGFLRRSPFIEEARQAGKAVEARRVSLGDPLDAALAAVASSFVETVVRGEPSRIKICRNKDCFWVFYDGSRNKSRRWCETTCGNLMKVRRFRRRRKMRSNPGRAGGPTVMSERKNAPFARRRLDSRSSNSIEAEKP